MLNLVLAGLGIVLALQAIPGLTGVMAFFTFLGTQEFFRFFGNIRGVRHLWRWFQAAAGKIVASALFVEAQRCPKTWSLFRWTFPMCACCKLI